MGDASSSEPDDDDYDFHLLLDLEHNDEQMGEQEEDEEEEQEDPCSTVICRTTREAAAILQPHPTSFMAHHVSCAHYQTGDSVCALSDTKLVFAGSRTLYVLDVSKREAKKAWTSASGIMSVVASDTGKFVVVCAWDGLFVWDTETDARPINTQVNPIEHYMNPYNGSTFYKNHQQILLFVCSNNRFILAKV